MPNALRSSTSAPIWQPIPNSSQELTIATEADQTLACGTRGGGKTMAQLMCFLQHVGRGFGPNWNGIIFDTEYKALADIEAKTHELFEPTGGKFNRSRADYCWHWPGGERFFLRAARTVKEAKGYLGHEYAFIAFNELTKWHTSEVLDHALATIRASKLRKMGLKPRVVMTTNPYGPGAIWVKDRYIDTKVPYGWLSSDLIPIDVGGGKVIEIPKTKIAIPSSYKENPHYSPQDVANLYQACEGRPELYEAWVRGSWDAPYLEGAIGSVWKSSVHIVDNFKPPPSWKHNRAFDWGSRAPFSVGWFAESDGEEWTDEKGVRRCYPRGTVFQFAEWYGTKKIGTNRGLGLSPYQIADGIKFRESNFVSRGVIHRSAKIYPGPADNQIDAVTIPGVDTIKTMMRARGTNWTESDKSKGSRAIGKEAIRTGLINASKREGAGLYFMRRCQAAIRILPSLEADGEDIADGQEDHLYDMLRYRLVQKKRGGSNVRVSF